MKGGAKARFKFVGISVLLLLLYATLFGPRLVSRGGSVGGRLSSLVDVLSSERVGNYNVAVLRGNDHLSISSWLDKHQFAPLRPGAAKVIDDYLKEGWVILAADLMRSGSGVMAAHPLQVTFKTEEPVYPMRLTGQADSTTDVRLFAFGTKSPLTHPDLKLEWADHVTTGLEYWRSWKRAQGAKGHFKYADGEPQYKAAGMDSPLLNNSWNLHKDRPTIYQPGLVKALGSGAFWLTRLQSRVPARKMKQDFILRPNKAVRPFQTRYYTLGGALHCAYDVLFYALSIAMPVLGLFMRRGTERAMAYKHLILGCMIVAGLDFFCLPKIWSSKNLHVPRYLMSTWMAMAPDFETIVPFLESVRMDKGETTESLTRRIEQYIEPRCKNGLTNQPLRREHSPGNYEIEWDGNDQLFFVYYPLNGYPFNGNPYKVKSKPD